MVAVGEREINDIRIIAYALKPIPPYGGCRQRIAKLAPADAIVKATTLSGIAETTKVGALILSAFVASFID